MNGIMIFFFIVENIWYQQEINSWSNWLQCTWRICEIEWNVRKTYTKIPINSRTLILKIFILYLLRLIDLPIALNRKRMDNNLSILVTIKQWLLQIEYFSLNSQLIVWIISIKLSYKTIVKIINTLRWC